MFVRKLQALGHPRAEGLNLDSLQDIKILVLWLEDQKIRHYKIEDRAQLHSFEGVHWRNIFLKYLKDLDCPYSFPSQSRNVIDWLLGVAIRYEYGDCCKEHLDLKFGVEEGLTKFATTESGTSAVDIDPHDKIFGSGVRALANILKVTHHPDPSILLEAIEIVIRNYLSQSALESHETQNPNRTFHVTAKDCGFNFSDQVLSEAAKVLRFLHIKELREMQTCINEVIVAVQALTADPKTDQSLGQIGK